jgi:S-DNA-T family DNA segregation ATPase FtsK/SpoIIIE
LRQEKFNKFADQVFKAGGVISELVGELYHGFKTKTMPVTTCNLIGGLLCLTMIVEYDKMLWRRLQLEGLYPDNPIPHIIYVILAALSGYAAWATGQVILKKKFTRRLKESFETAGLKTPLGRLPGFVFDRAVDEETRRLRLARHGLRPEDFKKAAPSLESSLQIYIDDVSEQREAGTIDVVYSHTPMPAVIQLPELSSIGKNRFVVGMSRSDTHYAELKSDPHILVAGKTGGGKSTMMRQAIVTLYLNNSDYEFTLVDLKEGLEFQIFRDIKRMTVAGSVSEALSALERLWSELTSRMGVLQAAKCKDIDGFNQLDETKRKEILDKLLDKPLSLGRHVVVIDEIAELFLASTFIPAKDSQRAREIVSKIARQGRAVGLHLLIGTQRPDARALDTQIKANLVGKVCFSMADLHSSMVVLGCARAKDLPHIPGRALWQKGLGLSEVQTPLILPEEVETLLNPHRIEKKSAPEVVETTASITPDEIKYAV